MLSLLFTFAKTFKRCTNFIAILLKGKYYIPGDQIFLDTLFLYIISRNEFSKMNLASLCILPNNHLISHLNYVCLSEFLNYHSKYLYLSNYNIDDIFIDNIYVTYLCQNKYNYCHLTIEKETESTKFLLSCISTDSKSVKWRSRLKIYTLVLLYYIWNLHWNFLCKHRRKHKMRRIYPPPWHNHAKTAVNNKK